MTEQETRPAVAERTDCCAQRALWGWSPPDLPADTPVKQYIDQRLPRTGLPAVLYLAFVAGLLLLAPLLPTRAELAVDGLAALAGASWCGLNFWRCRHAHCLITATGWLGLAGFSWAETGLGRSIIGGDEQLVLLGVLIVGLAFEGAWYIARGTNAVTCIRPRTAQP